uniref:Odorant-binding protein n=1 Tax=Phenacoccus solenopsis TaxID=483260 RepID=A0A0U2UYE2_9HEMI|nr:odorant-binding protein [Phenacoccus solenopsis]
MKYLIAICALCFVSCISALTDEQKAKLKSYKEGCIYESGLNPAVIEQIKKGGSVPFDDKLNCFSACLLKRLAIMKPDGSIDEAVARAKIPKEVPQNKANQVINICKSQVGRTQCETGGKVLGCLLKTKAVQFL